MQRSGALFALVGNKFPEISFFIGRLVFGGRSALIEPRPGHFEGSEHLEIYISQLDVKTDWSRRGLSSSKARGEETRERCRSPKKGSKSSVLLNGRHLKASLLLHTSTHSTMSIARESRRLIKTKLYLFALRYHFSSVSSSICSLDELFGCCVIVCKELSLCLDAI